MKPKLLVLCVAALATVGSLLLFARPPAATTPQSEPVATQSGYLLTVHNGKLAVFQNGRSEPELLLDVWVDSLPERDITRLKEGIPAESLTEAITLAEDYE